MSNNNQSHLNLRQKWRRRRASAIIETAAGICVLIPVLFLLLDIISLVIGQTINDDLANNAARAAMVMTNSANGSAAVDSYLNGTLFIGGNSLVSQVTIPPGGYFFDDVTTKMVYVTTQVTINLPIAVPFGGPKSVNMVAQASAPLVNITAKPIP